MKDRIFNALLLLSVALALGLSLIRGGGTAKISPESLRAADPIATLQPLDGYRARRAAERKLETDALLALAGKEALDAESRGAAAERLMALQRRTETELAVEALLTGRGYGEALCVADEKNLLIVLERSLEDSQAQEILYLVEELSAYPAQNIRITC